MNFCQLSPKKKKKKEFKLALEEFNRVVKSLELGFEYFNLRIHIILVDKQYPQ